MVAPTGFLKKMFFVLSVLTFISLSSSSSVGVSEIPVSSESSSVFSTSVDGSAIPSSFFSSSAFSFFKARAILITVLGFDMVTTLSQPT